MQKIVKHFILILFDIKIYNLRNAVKHQIVAGSSLVRKTTCASPANFAGVDILDLPDTVCSSPTKHPSMQIFRYN